MKILYLYAELMGYQVAIMKEYVSRYNAEVHIVHWDTKKLTPYKPPMLRNTYYYNRSDFSDAQLKHLAVKIKPDIVCISGWMDKGYLMAVRPLRKLGIPVVTGIDDIWWKTMKQKVASVAFPFFKTLFFSHAWVTGPYQYEYAKRLGFTNQEIIFNCYSADLEIFNYAYEISREKKTLKYPHRFLYAGRLESRKGVDLLIAAWEEIKELRKDWELCIAGNGSFHDSILARSDILFLEFMQPEVLINEIENIGCFILPSRFEAWGVVLHEFSAAGLPIICSDVCGAAPVFVTPGYNGFIFQSGNVNDLMSQMIRIINSNDDTLISFSENSHNQGQKISPEMSAASFVSVIKH